MSKIEVNTVAPQCGTTLTLGESGDTVTLGSGASQSGFGRTGTVDWQTGSIKTATFTAASGEGYFCNTAGGAFELDLPAGSAGAIVSIQDYNNTFDTANLTVDPNGTEKINGGDGGAPIVLGVQGQGVTFVYIDATIGWRSVQDNTFDAVGSNFITATGGTITEVGDFKVHTFTGPGTFTVNSTAVCASENVLEYLVIAAGGGGGGDDSGTAGGGGGAGGFRFASPSLSPETYPAKPLAAPAGITAAVQSYPVTVAAGGGAAGPATSPGGNGSNSIFGPITSTGGGGGASSGGPNGPTNAAQNGGSGGGAQYYNASSNGSGNTPPVSPSQGNDGGASVNPSNKYGSGGGGGALAAGVSTTACSPGGNGGAGGGFPNAFGTSGQSSSPFYYFSGGGGGGVWSNIPAPSYPSTAGGSGGLGGGGSSTVAGPNTPSPGSAGTTNTGGGGGGATGGNPATSTGGTGGSGIVIIRYKFQ